MKPDWNYIGYVIVSPIAQIAYNAKRFAGKVIARAICLVAGRVPGEPLRWRK